MKDRSQVTERILISVHYAMAVNLKFDLRSGLMETSETELHRCTLIGVQINF